MDRWKTYRDERTFYIKYVGRLGDSVNFRTLKVINESHKKVNKTTGAPVNIKQTKKIIISEQRCVLLPLKTFLFFLLIQMELQRIFYKQRLLSHKY